MSAALINALKLVNKEMASIKLVVSGAGAAGSAILFMLRNLGVKNIVAFRKEGIILKDDKHDFLTKELAEFTNPEQVDMSLAEALVGADVFIGVSAPRLLTSDMVKLMNSNAIIFALANPEPEIDYHIAKEAGAKVVATGRSDYPNQINNVLVFPGIFKGALRSRAKQITEAMKIKAAEAIASLVSLDELSDEYIIPSVFDARVAEAVSKAVEEESLKAL